MNRQGPSLLLENLGGKDGGAWPGGCIRVSGSHEDERRSNRKGRARMGHKGTEERKKEAGEKAYNYENQYHCCSQATLLALQEVLGLEDELALKAASSLCGGVALSGKTCGALTGGVMAIGMKHGRGDLKEGFASVLKAMLPANKLVRWFESEFGSTVCRDISGLEVTEEVLKMMMANPEAALKSLDPKMVEKCSQICRRTAEKVIEILEGQS